MLTPCKNWTFLQQWVEFNTKKIVVKILPGSVVAQTTWWATYISSGCKFPIVYMCQKLWKLAGSRQSCCKNRQAYFFGPPCRWHWHVQLRRRDITAYWLCALLNISQVFLGESWHVISAMESIRCHTVVACRSILSIGIILSSVCLSVCLSVCPCVCALWRCEVRCSCTIMFVSRRHFLLTSWQFCYRPYRCIFQPQHIAKTEPPKFPRLE